jgi:F-type H+-transporting ATPase subunit epsilon
MIKFKVVTPHRIMLEKEVDSVTLPTQTGQITILEHHIPLVSNLETGELTYKEKGQEFFFAVSGGFVEVKPNNEVIVMADSAEFGHEIDIQRAEEARSLAQKMMKENYQDQTASAEAMALLEKNLNRLRIAHKHRTHTNKNLESGILHE